MARCVLLQISRDREHAHLQASRTKYTHLADQDTSAGGWGNAARLPASMGMGASYSGANAGGIGTTQTGCWNCESSVARSTARREG